MATFRFRSNRWQAHVRQLGRPDETRSVLSHQEAERWARTVESGIDHGSSNCSSWPWPTSARNGQCRCGTGKLQGLGLHKIRDSFVHERQLKAPKLTAV